MLLIGFGIAAITSSAVGYGSKTTGGAGGQVVTVKTRDELNTALRNKSPLIVIIPSGRFVWPPGGRIGAGIVDKTIIGLPGAIFVTETSDAADSGMLSLSSGSNNVIIRNIIFEGPGAYDVDGRDCLTNEGTNIWVDHCEFHDGLDGNFDNTGGADDVTISWCYFHYDKPPRAGGSGGSDDHRFSNLVGGSDSSAPSDGHYSITFQYCWWGEGCRERMPRARNCQIHLLNCLWETSVDGSLAIGLSAGKQGSTVYCEGGNFKKITRVLKPDYDKGTPDVTFVNCLNAVDNFGNAVPKPTYSYTAVAPSAVEAAVKGSCGAGATLKVDSNGNATC